MEWLKSLTSFGVDSLKRRDFEFGDESSSLFRCHLKIMRGVPDTARITGDGANEPAIPRLPRKVSLALLHCERIVGEPIIAQSRLVARRAHDVVQMRGIVAVTGR